MDFKLKENVIPCKKDLIDLYKDAGWVNYTTNTEMLEKAYDNSLYVLTAWDYEKLIGAIRIVGDGHSIIYIQDILVLKDYQHIVIVSKLFTEAMDKYKHVYQKVLLTDNTSKTKSFYEKMGFSSDEGYGISFVQYNIKQV